MSTFTRILSISLVMVSFAFAVGANQGRVKEATLIQLQTTSRNFDTILVQGISAVAAQPLQKGMVTIVIYLADTQVIARFRARDIQRLTSNELTFDQFVRNCVLFS